MFVEYRGGAVRVQKAYAFSKEDGRVYLRAVMELAHATTPAGNYLGLLDVTGIKGS